MSLAPRDLPPPQTLSQGHFELVVKRLADDLAFGTRTSQYVGSGIEYAQSRPYAEGDSVQHMDWRLTARSSTAYVKEYEALKRVSAFLVLDTSASMDASSVALTKHELGLWIAAATGLALVQALCPVAIHSGGQRKTRATPSLNRGHVWQALAELREPRVAERTELAWRLDLLGVTARQRSLVMVLSDFHEPGAVESLSRLAQRHDCVALWLEDPAEGEPLRAGFLRGVESETGRSFLAGGAKRFFDDRKLDERLASYGIDALRLRTDRPFLAPLKHFLVARGGLLRGAR
jgi:uncharacterized protein (DUF58 family)